MRRFRKTENEMNMIELMSTVLSNIPYAPIGDDRMICLSAIDYLEPGDNGMTLAHLRCGTIVELNSDDCKELKAFLMDVIKEAKKLQMEQQGQNLIQPVTGQIIRSV